MNSTPTTLLTIFARAVGVITVFLTTARGTNAVAPIDYFNSMKGTLQQSGLSTESPVTFTLFIIKAFLSLVGLIAFVLIIYGGFTMMTSAGAEDKIKKGRDVLFWAIIGTIVIFSALGIVVLVDSTLGS